MKIDALMYRSGTAGYYTDEFRRVLEDHMTLFRNDEATTALVLRPIDAYRYAGDFYGLITYLGVKAELHWLCMRMNKLKSTQDAFDHLTAVLAPDSDTVQRIWSSYNSTHSVKT